MALPAGWDTGVDATGRTYYVNHDTQQTQWEPPTDGGGSMAPQSYQPSEDKNSMDLRALPQASAVEAMAVPPAHSSLQHQSYPNEAVTQQPGQGSTVVVLQGGVGGIPHNAPQGGVWIQERYCGIITWLVGIFIFPCVCCCPCDDRPVYVVNGTRYNKYGAIVPPGCC